MRRTDRLPARPDLGLPRATGARRDPTLLAVIAIGLVAVAASAFVTVDPPAAHVVQVAASATPSPTATPTASPGEADHAAARVPTGPGGPYSFLDATDVQGRREPVRWNPCEPIEYQVDLEVRPTGARSAIASAVAETSRATGIAFHFDGASPIGAHALFDHFFLADAIDTAYRPVLVTVVSGNTFDTFEPSKRAVAFAHPEEGHGLLDHQYVAGVVVVDGSVHYPTEGRWSLALVVQHELGHLMGLAHVRAPDELMFSFEEAPHTIPQPISGWGPGDLAGLERLGVDQGCLEHVRVRG
jgi:Matrixin